MLNTHAACSLWPLGGAGGGGGEKSGRNLAPSLDNTQHHAFHYMHYKAMRQEGRPSCKYRAKTRQMHGRRGEGEKGVVGEGSGGGNEPLVTKYNSGKTLKLCTS